MSNPAHITYADPTTWVKNSSLLNTKPVGSTLSQVNVNGYGNRVAMADLAAMPADTVVVTVAEGFQVAACAFDSEGGYLGNTDGYSRFMPWSSATERTVTRPDGAAYWCLYLRRGTGSPALLPDEVAESALDVAYETSGGGSIL